MKTSRSFRSSAMLLVGLATIGLVAVCADALPAAAAAGLVLAGLALVVAGLGRGGGSVSA